MNIQITIQSNFSGRRLDALVGMLCDTCSRARARQLIIQGDIRVNRSIKKPGYRVKSGDVVSGDVPDAFEEPRILPVQMDLDILFEDDHLMIINKKAGMVVHPARPDETQTLVNALLFHDPDIKKTCDDSFRSGIVHRLDKDTSGLMVVAKTPNSLKFLQKEFKQRRVEKKYLALVHGHMPENQGEINLPIGRHPVKRKMMAVSPEDGKTAITLWSVKETYPSASLVEVLLKTGRTHQIRVHFYALDHPLVGDIVYQYRRFRKKTSIAPRQMLHAFFLSFRHPHTGKKIEFTAGPPDDFLKTRALMKIS